MGKKQAILLIILLGFLVYFNSFFNGFYYDDFDSILGNPLTSSIINLPSFFTYSHSSPFLEGLIRQYWGNFYRPMTITYLSLVYSLFGATPFFFTFFQVTLHICNAILIFLLFSIFFNRIRSLLLAGIFLIHPINIEAVSHIGVADTLFLFFGLLSLNFLISKKDDLKNYLVIGLSLLLSLLSKETGFLFIPIIIIFTYFNKRKSTLEYFYSCFTAVFVYLFLRFGVAGVFLSKTDYSVILNASFPERLLTVPKIIFYYVQTFIFPSNLSIAQQWLVRNANLRDFFIPLGIDLSFFITIFGFLIYLRNSHQKYLATYLLFFFWFILGLIPHIQIFPQITTVADRWFYFPIIGLLGMIGVATQNIKITSRLRLPTLFICILMLSLLSIRTIIRNFNWKDNLTLYSHDINTSESYILDNNLGDEYSKKDNLTKAKELFENSIKTDPGGWINWNNLGNIYYNKGDFKKAKEYYQKAINNGHYELAYLNMAILMLENDHPESTINFTEDALKKFPGNFKLWRVLALAENKFGNRQKALEAARKSISIYSDSDGQNLYQALQNQK